jgi:hypothetical protein
MLCPQHQVEFVLKPAGISKRTGQPYNAFYACPTFGCKERPPRAGNYAPRPNSYATPKPERNFDKEAYEKCCSIWLAALLGRQNVSAVTPDFEQFWNLFQAIRADGEKRFATGWNKAVQTFSPSATADEPPPEETW